MFGGPEGTTTFKEACLDEECHSHVTDFLATARGVRTVARWMQMRNVKPDLLLRIPHDTVVDAVFRSVHDDASDSDDVNSCAMLLCVLASQGSPIMNECVMRACAVHLRDASRSGARASATSRKRQVALTFMRDVVLTDASWAEALVDSPEGLVPLALAVCASAQTVQEMHTACLALWELAVSCPLKGLEPIVTALLANCEGANLETALRSGLVLALMSKDKRVPRDADALTHSEGLIVKLVRSAISISRNETFCEEAMPANSIFRNSDAGLGTFNPPLDRPREYLCTQVLPGLVRFWAFHAERGLVTLGTTIREFAEGEDNNRRVLEVLSSIRPRASAPTAESSSPKRAKLQHRN